MGQDGLHIPGDLVMQSGWKAKLSCEHEIYHGENLKYCGLDSIIIAQNHIQNQTI